MNKTEKLDPLTNELLEKFHLGEGHGENNAALVEFAYRLQQRLAVPTKNDADGKLSKLKSALVGLVGAESKEDLDAMEIVIRSSSAPDFDKTAAINAIDALRACSND